MDRSLSSNVGRRSHGMEEDDWRNLALAYDTWNENAVCCEGEWFVDEDVKALVKDIFDCYGLWDEFYDAPNLDNYRQMIMNRC